MGTKATRFDKKYRDNRTMIAKYLNASIATGKAAVVIEAIGNVMRAKGMSEFSTRIGVHREGLYRSFGGKMSPRFKTVFDVLAVLDIQIVARRRPSRG
jgi:probable addiction module antidote protein